MNIPTSEIVSVLIGVFIPIIVNIITQRGNDLMKALLLPLFSAITGFLSIYLSDTVHFDWQNALFTSIVTYVTAIATTYGFYEPTDIDYKLDGLAARTLEKRRLRRLEHRQSRDAA